MIFRFVYFVLQKLVSEVKVKEQFVVATVAMQQEPLCCHFWCRHSCAHANDKKIIHRRDAQCNTEKTA